MSNKIKISDLTVRDIKRICKRRKRCYMCPLEKHQWLCLGLKNMKESELKKEVEVKE